MVSAVLVAALTAVLPNGPRGMTNQAIAAVSDSAIDIRPMARPGSEPTSPMARPKSETTRNEGILPALPQWRPNDHPAAKTKAAKAVEIPQNRLPTVAADFQRTVVVNRGDTLMKLMVREGVERRVAAGCINALVKVYNPRRLMPGQEIILGFQRLEDGGPGPEAEEIAEKHDSKQDGQKAEAPADKTVEKTEKAAGKDGEKEPQDAVKASGASETPTAPAGRLVSLSVKTSAERNVQVNRDIHGAFQPYEHRVTLTARKAFAESEISSSLAAASGKVGLPASIQQQMVNLFSFDVDFQRDIQKGNRFEVIYEQLYDESGEIAKEGNLLYAGLFINGDWLRYFRFTTRKGDTGYFDAEGKGVRKTLMRTPINGARLTSGFGRRRHPVLGYTRMHRGVDFAARTGTPVLAAGDGTIETIGWKSGYGRYIKLRHNSTYSTAYAHMSRFRLGLRRGTRVHQSQVIGYVGRSGRATGPHLHYEIHKNGQQVNPLRVRMPTAVRLSKADMKTFKRHRAETSKLVAQLRGKTQIARLKPEQAPEPVKE